MGWGRGKPAAGGVGRAGCAAWGEGEGGGVGDGRCGAAGRCGRHAPPPAATTALWPAPASSDGPVCPRAGFVNGAGMAGGGGARRAAPPGLLPGPDGPGPPSAPGRTARVHACCHGGPTPCLAPVPLPPAPVVHIVHCPATRTLTRRASSRETHEQEYSHAETLREGLFERM